MIVTESEIRAVWRVVKQLPVEMLMKTPFWAQFGTVFLEIGE
jgi:hypothetical protein